MEGIQQTIKLKNNDQILWKNKKGNDVEGIKNSKGKEGKMEITEGFRNRIC